MPNFNPLTRPTTDGFIQKPSNSGVRPRTAKKTGKLISDMVIADAPGATMTQQERHARLVFYTKLAEQRVAGQPAHLPTSVSVGHDLSLTLFQNDIEARVQRELQQHDDNAAKRRFIRVSRRHRRIVRQLNKAKHHL